MRFSVTSFKPLICPKCAAIVDFRDIQTGKCPVCHTPIRTARSYWFWQRLSTLLIITTIAVATYTPESGGTWILAITALFVPVLILMPFILPPWLERGAQEELGYEFSFFGAYVLSFVVALVYGFIGVGWAIVVLGKPRDLREHLDMLSLPLCLLKPSFLITPRRSLLDVVGIILGNSWFYAVGIFVLYKVMHNILKRRRVTRMNLSGRGPEEDE